jgi:hypothetical protein
MATLEELLQAINPANTYQRYIGQPFANVAGPFGRGFLGLQRPEYGSEEAYRTGQAVSNMPAAGIPAGAMKAAAQVPGLLADVVQAAKGSDELAGLLALTAYHGSPHRFSKFDASKIGTGEGAQAYGHGLYFAENPSVANEYRRTLRNMNPSYDGVELNDTLRKTAAEILLRVKGDKAAAIKEAERYAFDNLLIPEITKMDPSKVSYGAFYTVDIPDEMIGKMLDWDKPLSQQSQTVMDALQKSGLIADVERVGSVAAEKVRQLAQQPRVAEWAKRDLMKDAEQLQISKSPKHVAGVLKRMQMDYGISPDSGPFSDVAGDFLSFVKGMQAVPNMDTGGGAISFLQAMYGNAGASQKLREAGIPGIRYLDQGSRGTGKGTRNFVVFPGEEEALKMLSVE